MPRKNRFTREQKIKALKIARGYIEAKKVEFICNAIRSTLVGDYLRKYIEEELQGAHDFSQWLCQNRPKLHVTLYGSGSLPCSTYDDEIRKLRIRWLDWMIENAT